MEGLKEEIVVSPDHVLHIISGGEGKFNLFFLPSMGNIFFKENLSQKNF